MASCEIQTGIFVLRTCGNPSRGNCKVCGKSTCSKHSRDLEGTIICMECLVVEQKSQAGSKKRGRSRDDDWDQDIGSDFLWYYMLKDELNDSFDFSGFDSRDYDGFTLTDDTVVWDGEDDGGLFDS